MPWRQCRLQLRVVPLGGAWELGVRTHVPRHCSSLQLQATSGPLKTGAGCRSGSLLGAGLRGAIYHQREVLCKPKGRARLGEGPHLVSSLSLLMTLRQVTSPPWAYVFLGKRQQQCTWGVMRVGGLRNCSGRETAGPSRAALGVSLV